MAANLRVRHVFRLPARNAAPLRAHKSALCPSECTVLRGHPAESAGVECSLGRVEYSCSEVELEVGLDCWVRRRKRSTVERNGASAREKEEELADKYTIRRTATATITRLEKM